MAVRTERSHASLSVLISLAHVRSDSRDNSFSYEMRRECQEILPGLLLGPFTVSKQLDKLLSLAITHM